jgi:hypothetical protein
VQTSGPDRSTIIRASLRRVNKSTFIHFLLRVTWS